VKTPKADVISKDLVRRGFRSVGPTVIYTFMQVAGLTNDHLISCYRFDECAAVATTAGSNGGGICAKDSNCKEEKRDGMSEEVMVGNSDLELSRAVDGLSVVSSS